MAKVLKIDSNITGLAYAEEAALGFLPGEGGYPSTPKWNRLNPNTYNDFGGEIVTVAPNPINPSRQRRKGVTTDLNASAGFNHNLSFENLTDLMQGVMFADIRKRAEQICTLVNTDTTNPDRYNIANTTGFLVGSLIIGRGFANAANNGLNVVTVVTTNTDVRVLTGQLIDETPPATADVKVVGYQFALNDINIVTTGDFVTMTSTAAFNFTTLGLVPGQWVYLGGDVATNGFANAVNNGFKRVRSISSTGIVFDKSDAAMVAETGAATGKSIRMFFGDVLRNETGSLIKRRSYNIERTLGAPDDALPAQIQSEVITGAVANEFTLNIPQADLANVDISFLGIDNVQRTGVTGPKQTGVLTSRVASEFNTSSDVNRIRLAVVDIANEAPTALFAYVTEATISINNNVSANKAVGILGAFDMTAGTFQVSGSLTAYFADVPAVQAVRNNTSVTLDISFVKDNKGLFFDLPLLSLGDGRLNVEIDQAITLPLNTDAASGEDVLSTLNHTLLITYFNWLPNAA